MALFHDALGGLDDFEGLSLPDGFGETITGAYDADLAEATAAATTAAQADIAAIVTGAVTEAVAAAVTEFKAAAFSAVMGVGDDTEQLGTEASTTVELPDDNDNDSDMTPAMSGLFTKDED